MKLSDEQRAHMERTGIRILGALEQITGWADSLLNRDQQRLDSTQPETARLSIATSLAEVRRGAELLWREPAIARIVVEWQEESRSTGTFLVCRGGAAGAPAIDGVPLASYRSPVGRLVEHEPGDVASVPIGGQSRTGRITERDRWVPNRAGDLWDAEDCSFELQTWQRVVTSVRRLIAEAQRLPVEAPLEAIIAAAEEAENVLLKLRRRAIDRIALRDQPILDRHQGEVFRMPLDRRVFLIGPPGTGKTTTLIKRVAQKQTLSELLSDEVDLVSSLGLAERFTAQDAWAMFSPTQLLMLYLRDAFNREGVPASGRHLRTWQRDRRQLARNAIPILRTETRGRFREAHNEQTLRTSTSAALSELHDSLYEYHLTDILVRVRDALDSIAQSAEDETAQIVSLLRDRLQLDRSNSPQQIQRLCPAPQLLRDVAARIQKETRQWTDREANRALRARPTLLDELLSLLTESGPPEEDPDEEPDPDEGADGTILPPSSESEASTRRRAAELLIRALRSFAVAAARKGQPRGRNAEVLALLHEELPEAEEASRVGQRVLLRNPVVALINVPRRWVLDVVGTYSRFRRDHPALYATDIPGANEVVSGDEIDILLLLALRNARTLQEGLRGQSPPDWMSPITYSYIPQVYVDEATDFSAVQLAALLELSHPRLRSWFACGDFKQRVTQSGIASEAELRWIERVTAAAVPSGIELKTIGITYRQSSRLRELADALDPDLTTLRTAGPTEYPDDPAPLLLETASPRDAGSWLAARTVEIETALGGLPSIAVFVNGDEKIAPVLSAAEAPLREHTIQIVGCPEGRIVGDAQEVRVFDVRHIKGLEFEAVFFLGLDEFAGVEPELFHRFFYVGLTRAATYLGITCRAKLPERLAPVRPLFCFDGWRG